MSEVKLSYVITTFNKLPHLKEVLRLLIENVRHDEEIVITDGGSSDGTQAFLQNLFKQGKIKRYISEKDRGEAHGYNKSMLMAKGDLIKIITDDDVFYYPAIRECRQFMEAHMEIDAIVGNNCTGYSRNLAPPFLNPEMRLEFEKWIRGEQNTFYCNGLPLMIRKSSLSLLGLFNPRFLCVDIEYTIRTGSIANYAFATRFIATRIINDQSNSDRFVERCKLEQRQLCKIYDYSIPPTWVDDEIIKVERSGWWRFKNYINSMLPTRKQVVCPRQENVEVAQSVEKMGLDCVHQYYYTELEKLNQKIDSSFLTKNKIEA